MRRHAPWPEPQPDGRRVLRQLLIAGLVGTVLLPVFIAIVAGLGGLLGALGDGPAARACGWIAVVTGAVWLATTVATTMLSAAAVLAGPIREPRPPRRPRRRARRELRPRDEA
jgi:hypothetical protein